MAANDAFKKRLKRREDMFLRRLFGILAKMAKADGKVDAWEAHAAEGAFVRFPRAAERRGFCTKVFNSAKNSRTPLTRFAAEFADTWASSKECLVVYEILWDIACAKGILHPAHKVALREVCASLRLPHKYFEIFYRRRRPAFREVASEEPSSANGPQGRTGDGSHDGGDDGDTSGRRRRPSPPPRKTLLEEAYELLGCSPSDTNDVVRRAYRNAAKAYHPDMLRAKGSSEAQVRAASETMARVNSAWELIRKKRRL
jgi:DnaJ like chaperone protein